MNSEPHMSLEELLDTIMLEESEPNYAALAKWSQRYPEHRDALASYFATWAVQKEPRKAVAIDEDRVSQLVVSHALNLLHRQGSAQTASAATVALPRLHVVIASCGFTEEDIAARCCLDESIMAKLDRRLIRVTSIPRVCFERLGAALNRGVDMIQAMLAGPPIPAGSYKALNRPALKVENFLDAVRTSDLSDALKSEWTKIVQAETTPEGTK